MLFFPYNEDVEKQIKQIKRALHVRMNGEVSDNMTQKGYRYKLNYGTLLSELKELSQRFTPGKLLADRLWHMYIRETMILATYLYPVNEFKIETARQWLQTIPTQEIAEIVCMNLFSKLSYAEEFADECLKGDEMSWLTAWILLTRIVENISDTEKYLDIIAENFKADNQNIKQYKMQVLKKLSGKDKETANHILDRFSFWQQEENNKVFYEELKDEISFYYDLFEL